MCVRAVESHSPERSQSVAHTVLPHRSWPPVGSNTAPVTQEQKGSNTVSFQTPSSCNTVVSPASAAMSVRPAGARLCPPSGRWCPGSFGLLWPPLDRPLPLTRHWKEWRGGKIQKVDLLHFTLRGSEMVGQKLIVTRNKDNVKRVHFKSQWQ